MPVLCITPGRCSVHPVPLIHRDSHALISSQIRGRPKHDFLRNPKSWRRIVPAGAFYDNGPAPCMRVRPHRMPT